MTKLDFRASNIAHAERADGKHFFNVFSNFGNGDIGVDELLFIWHCGGGDDLSFDDTFKQGVPALMETIMEGINDAGFLGVQVDTKQMRAAMEQAMQTTGAALQNTGESNKKQPTK
jgi:hypothetical protein